MKKYFCTILVISLLLWPAAASAEFYYFHEDHLGGSSVVTDENGDVTAIYDYMPYGEAYIDEVYDPEFNNDYKFTDQEEDSETGLYYYDARYYNPVVGGFYSQDPAVYDERLLENLQNPQALNSYSYVLNNPLKYTDPSGETALSTLFWKGISAGLNVFGYDIASEFLSYSVVNNVFDSSVANSDVFQRDPKEFSGSDHIGQTIKGSGEYQDVLKNIQASISSGNRVGSGDFEYTSNSNNKDLFLAFGKVEYSYTVMSQGLDGSYNVEVVLSDLYNFDEFRSYNGNIVPSIANNLGFISKNSGYLTDYYSVGILNETIDGESN